MHHGHDSPGLFYHLFGVGLMWLQDHGLGLVGALSALFGMWLQWKTYRLREREDMLRRLEKAWESR